MLSWLWIKDNEALIYPYARINPIYKLCVKRKQAQQERSGNKKIVLDVYKI